MRISDSATSVQNRKFRQNRKSGVWFVHARAKPQSDSYSHPVWFKRMSSICK